MAQHLLETKQAADSDFDYCWHIYKESVRPIIEGNVSRTWNDQHEKDNFRKTLVDVTSYIITLDGGPIGFASAAISDKEVRLDHVYLEEQHRGQGYGTKLVTEMLGQWKAQGKDVIATAVKGSRVMSFIDRIGPSRSDAQVHSDQQKGDSIQVVQFRQ